MSAPPVHAVPVPTRHWRGARAPREGPPIITGKGTNITKVLANERRRTAAREWVAQDFERVASDQAQQAQSDRLLNDLCSIVGTILSPSSVTATESYYSHDEEISPARAGRSN